MILLAAVAGWSAVGMAHPAENGSYANASELRIAAEDALFSIPFEVKDGRIYVDVMVDGDGPFTFAIDTGAGGDGRADLSLVSALGLAFIGEGEASDGVNTQTVNTVHLQEINIGGYIRNDIEVMARDYSSRMPVEQRIHGILGRDFFSDGTLVIDYPQRTLSFVDRSLIDASDKDALPFERPFRVPVMIGGTAVETNLDTGANVEMVMPLELFGQFDTGELEAAGDATLTNTKLKSQQGVIHGPIKLGAVEFADVPVRVSARFPEMMIGARVLQNYRIIIDQKAGLIAVQH